MGHVTTLWKNIDTVKPIFWTADIYSEIVGCKSFIIGEIILANCKYHSQSFWIFHSATANEKNSSLSLIEIVCAFLLIWLHVVATIADLQKLKILEYFSNFIDPPNTKIRPWPIIGASIPFKSDFNRLCFSDSFSKESVIWYITYSNRH